MVLAIYIIPPRTMIRITRLTAMLPRGVCLIGVMNIVVVVTAIVVVVVVGTVVVVVDVVVVVVVVVSMVSPYNKLISSVDN